MNIPDPVFLRKAIEIKTEIEHIESQLHELLNGASSKNAAIVSKIIKKPLRTISQEVKQIPQEGNHEQVHLQKVHLQPTDQTDAAPLSASPVPSEPEAPHAEPSHAETPNELVGMISSSRPHEETLLLVDDRVDDRVENQEAFHLHQEISPLDTNHQSEPTLVESCHFTLQADQADQAHQAHQA